MVRKLAAAALFLLAVLPSSSAVASGDIGVIAFTSDRDGNSEIYSARLDGSGQTNLTHDAATDQSPAFSSKGDRIAFVSNRDGRMDLWVMNANGTDPQKVATGDPGTLDAEPSWSPDGAKLVFSSTRSGDGYHLFIVELASGTITRLTSGWGVQPAWSPDGTRIAYTDGNALKLINADGTNDQFLSCGCLGPEASPAWTPSGGNIVFARYDQDWQTTNVRQLYMIPASGGNAIPITSGAYYQDHPSFSPDGSMLVFQRQDPPMFGAPELYAMNLSDLAPFPVVTSPGRNFVPSWGPTFLTPPPPPPPAQDTTPPTITLNRPASATDRYDTYTVGQVVLADYSCADEAGGSGLRHCSGTVPNGAAIDTRSIGLFDFYVFAADNAGNPIYKWTKYRVIYPFTGFYSPLTAGLNDLRAGDSAPLKFSLGTDYGLDVLTSATQQQEDCTTGALLGSSSPAGGSLTYNATQLRYLYNWSSDKSWGGTCRAVTLTLRDGTSHRADFRLGK